MLQIYNDRLPHSKMPIQSLANPNRVMPLAEFTVILTDSGLDPFTLPRVYEALQKSTSRASYWKKKLENIDAARNFIYVEGPPEEAKMLEFHISGSENYVVSKYTSSSMPTPCKLDGPNPTGPGLVPWNRFCELYRDSGRTLRQLYYAWYDQGWMFESDRMSDEQAERAKRERELREDQERYVKTPSLELAACEAQLATEALNLPRIDDFCRVLALLGDSREDSEELHQHFITRKKSS